jgi:hypothetical protein
VNVILNRDEVIGRINKQFDENISKNGANNPALHLIFLEAVGKVIRAYNHMLLGKGKVEDVHQECIETLALCKEIFSLPDGYLCVEYDKGLEACHLFPYKSIAIDLLRWSAELGNVTPALFMLMHKSLTEAKP